MRHGDYAVKLPDRKHPIQCASDAEVIERLEEFRRRHPGTLWGNVIIDEL
ncbi:MAG TPA: hypothetical protein VF101_04560 [Gaiellaceae bacterium]